MYHFCVSWSLWFISRTSFWKSWVIVCFITCSSLLLNSVFILSEEISWSMRVLSRFVRRLEFTLLLTNKQRTPLCRPSIWNPFIWKFIQIYIMWQHDNPTQSAPLAFAWHSTTALYVSFHVNVMSVYWVDVLRQQLYGCSCFNLESHDQLFKIIMLLLLGSFI